MGRPRTISASSPTYPIGPFRVADEHKRALERWASRRALVDAAGGPKLADAFRDLAQLAATIIAVDVALEQLGMVNLATLLRERIEEVEDQSSKIILRAYLGSVAEALASRTPATTSAAGSSPTQEENHDRQEREGAPRRRRRSAGKGSAAAG